MTSKDGASPSTSSIFLPQLRHPRRGSLGSLSNPSQLDGDTLAQALDQIHNVASQTDTLTTFNEYTSPPSSSSGTDGKGIASELQGGLSGLYSRIRASVGNVKDIVTLANDDGAEEKSLKSPQIATFVAAPSARYAAKLSTSSATALNPNTGPKSAGQSGIEGTAGPELGPSAKDQTTKPSKTPTGNFGPPSQTTFSSGSILHSPVPPFTQGILGTAARPAVAEINVSATKERDPSGDVSSNELLVESSAPQNQSSGSRAQTYLGGNAEKQNSKLTESSRVLADPGSSGHRVNAPRTTLENAMIAASRSRDVGTGKEVKHARERGSIPDNDYFFHSGFDGIDNVVQPTAKRPASTTKSVTETPRITTNFTTPRDDIFLERTSTGDIADVNNDPLKERSYQHLEVPTQKSSVPSQTNQVASRDRGSPLKASFEPTIKPSSTTSRSSVPSRQQPIDAEARQIAAASQPRGSVTPLQDEDLRTMNVFSQIKSKILNKEYWMRDENARDCFYCGDPFSTFRRKHHCSKRPYQGSSRGGKIADMSPEGTCGQIFDAKCTSLISGDHFAQSGSLRVCKPCEGIINGYDDSSEYSDDSYQPSQSLRPRHGSTGASDALGSRSSTPVVEDFRQSPKHPGLTIPTMAIPATRRPAGESNKKAVLEIDGERTLLRPSSSRSLKSSSTNRPYSSGHRRHNSRHQNLRGFRVVGEESAPFHRNPAEERGKQDRLPAFHDDNIIDPDLAPYLSDEASSGDEQVSIMTAMDGDGSRGYDSERHGLTGLMSSSKKGRSRFGEKTISGVMFASRDTDNNSLSSLRSMNLPRSSKRRNLSIAGNLHLRSSPRSHRVGAVMPAIGLNPHESVSNSGLSQMLSSNASLAGSRVMRSSSMRGAAAPAVELNNASLQHVRKLLRQLLQDSDVPSIASWEKALVPILLRSTDDVNPDVLNGDDIDIRHYVKLKRISGGRPGDTSYVSGLVFTKNLALKSMPRTISYPSILILTFPLEYARHQQHFMSLEPVIRQEREFLHNLVSRIVALRPQLLLVQRNVSGLALEFLEKAKIATAYNVKASVLEAVSRCTQTRIVSSIDKLAIKPAYTGKCEVFYLKTYVHGSKKKTYMFLSGCAKELGCTIVLRGAKNETLAKIKRITEFMVYVVYNLKLETCLMRDEFALIPSSNEDTRPVPAHEASRHTLQEAQSTLTVQNNPAADQAASAGQDSNPPSSTKSPDPGVSNQQASGRIPADASVPDDVPMPTFYGDMVEQHQTKILSASPFVKFAQPYLLMRAREQERRLVYLKRLRDQNDLDEIIEDDKSEPQKFDLIKPEMIHSLVRGPSKKVREVIHAVHDAEYDKALHNYKTHTKQWEAYIAGNINMFDPYEHQNIAVLYSVVCTVTTVPCSGPDLLALSFYNEHEIDEEFEADCTLGQYVEDLCLGANTVCTANGCERRMLDHHRQYVHGEAQVSVFVERYPCRLRGLQNTILMWSCCRICGQEAQVIPMSESSWKYSFGKYLELSFWSSKLRARADVCPHDLHRDHLRYFGFHDIALRFHYDSINLLEIIVPRARVTWKVDNDLRFKNELFAKIEERLNKYMTSVKARIRSIKVDSVIPEKTESCKQEVENLMKNALDQHQALLQILQDLYMNSKYYEIIPLNQALRATQEKVAEWDNTFAEFDRNFFPSEKDIRRLATLQLRKIFLDKDDSTISMTSTDEGSASSILEDIVIEKSNAEETPALVPRTRSISPEKANDLLNSVVEKHAFETGSPERDELDHNNSTRTTPTPIIPPNPSQLVREASGLDEVQHLDLAINPSFSEKVLDKEITTSPDTIFRKMTAEESISIEDQGRTASPLLVSNLEESPSNSKTMSAQHPMPNNSVLPNLTQISSIPRASERGNHRMGGNMSPTFHRTQSHPVNFQSEKTNYNQSSIFTQAPGSNIQIRSFGGETGNSTSNAGTTKPVEKKLSERLGLGVLKQTASPGHSLIPRSIVNKRKDSNVSNLAKHFEQLSREFEKERIRERRQRAAKTRQARAHPMAASRPIVEVYRNVHEAVEEREPSDEDLLSSEPSQDDQDESPPETLNHSTDLADSQPPAESSHREDTTADTTETEEANHHDSRIPSDTEGDGGRSEEERSILDDAEIPGTTEEHHALTPSEAQLDLKLELPKHEKSSLMKMLTNFWAERSASGWQPLDYPLNASDHIFADSDIIVREDEPSSLIAFALSSEDYQAKLKSISENFGGRYRRQEKGLHQDATLDPEEQLEVERSLLRSTGTHLKYQFQEGSAKMLCKVFFAEQFDAVRRKCGVDERIVESLSRCLKWDSKGGKTKSVFLKTLDDRLVLKSLSPIETQAFLRFAPAYFRIMSEALFHELPSVIAKMLGFYQIIIKNSATGTEFNWFLLVMENLFYDRTPTRIFDLKGSMRNRRIQSTGEQNEVLLDENMVEFIYESPLFSREHSKRILRASVWNDTLFLSRQNVMDYSLMIAIDENRKELVIGIIDCIRTYTWDKKLETWIKDRGKTRPTVTSPREYKNRFREAMGRYVLQAPNCWHQFKAQQVETRPLKLDDRDEPKDADGEGELLRLP